MKIGHKKYLRTYIALSSIAASLLVGNKVAFAEEGDGTVGESAPIESTDPMQQQNHQRKKKQKLQCRCLSKPFWMLAVTVRIN